MRTRGQGRIAASLTRQLGWAQPRSAVGWVVGAAATLLALGVAPGVAADEARISVPPSLAEWVEVGESSGLLVSLERGEARAVATVSQGVQPVLAARRSLTSARASSELALNLEVPRGFDLPPGVARLRIERLAPYEVLFQVVRFVSLVVRLDEGDGGAQDAVSVLRRGTGRCSGRANLAVGLLRALEFPARVVHGVLMGGGSARWHRWGEVWLEGAGWVPFDVGASVGLVSVRYLPARGAVAGATLVGAKIEHLDESGFLSLPRRGALRVLPWEGVTLHCRARSGEDELAAVLLGPDGLRRARRGWGEVVFRGLLPGVYTLGWQTGEVLVRAVQVDLRGRHDVRLSLGGG